MSDTQPTAPGRLKALLHIAGALAFAIAQPGYDLLSRHPQFFVARKATAPEVIAAVLVLGIVLPVMLWLIYLGARAAYQRAGDLLLAGLIGFLGGCVCIQVLNRTAEVPGQVSLALALAVMIALATLYFRLSSVRGFFTLLSPAAVLFPVLFLFFSPVSKILLDRGQQAVGTLLESDTPVVLLILDELPTASLMAQDRNLDERTFPAFADLARSATWYRNATTVAAGSLNAIPAILTGRYPVHTRMPNAVDYPQNLFALLGQSHEITAFEPITALCADHLCDPPPERSLPEALASLGTDLWIVYQHLLFPEAYTDTLPSISDNWMNFNGEPPEFEPVNVDKTDKTDTEIVHEIKHQSRDRVIRASGMDYTTAFANTLATLQPGERPALHVQHIQLPHVPWRYLPSGKQYKEQVVHGKQGRDQWVDEQPWLMAQGLQRHLLQVAYVDTLLAQLLAHLRELALYDRAMIIVTADHGASFQQGAQRRTVTPQNVAEIAGVPLLIKYPGQRESVISDAVVEIVDIVPTIAAVLGNTPPWDLDGYSLLDAPGHERPITVRSNLGAPTTLAPGDLARRDWLLKFKTTWFGAGNTIDNLFGLGPGRIHLGKAATALEAKTSASLNASLIRPVQYEKVYLHSPYVPARISGQLHGDGAMPPDNTPVVVSINGTVHGSGVLFSKDGERGHFSVMVPAAPFTAGANTVAVFLAGANDAVIEVPINHTAD